MKIRFRAQPGFSLMELMIVVAIVIILAAAGISGSSRSIKNLRFRNHFNQIVFMVQEARNLAITGKEKNAVSYSVKFDFMADPNQASVYETKVDASTTPIETYNFATGSNLIMFSSPPPICNNTVILTFTSQTGATQITCDGGAQVSVSVGVKDTTSGQAKSFFIHQIAGIPQF